MIYIGLKRGTGFYSMLIRTWTRSKYSHAMVVVDISGIPYVFEATAKSGTIERSTTFERLKKEGVEIFPANKLFPNEFGTWSEDVVVGRLLGEIGTAYDWTAIFYSRIFNIDRQESKKWFCFELVAWAFGMAKSWRWTGRTFQDKLEGVI